MQMFPLKTLKCRKRGDKNRAIENVKNVAYTHHYVGCVTHKQKSFTFSFLFTFLVVCWSYNKSWVDCLCHFNSEWILCRNNWLWTNALEKEKSWLNDKVKTSRKYKTKEIFSLMLKYSQQFNIIFLTHARVKDVT